MPRRMPRSDSKGGSLPMLRQAEICPEPIPEGARFHYVFPKLASVLAGFREEQVPGVEQDKHYEYPVQSGCNLNILDMPANSPICCRPSPRRIFCIKCMFEVFECENTSPID